MAKDDDDNDGLPPIGEGTETFLEDAKKGKPRSFLLVCKGAKVNYLAVKKKPIKAAELMSAKKAGYKGDGYFGVITGKGMELVFNLARADGYEAAPIKDKALKDFLEEHAELKSKPTFAIVDTLPAIPDDDAETPPSPTTSPSNELSNKLLQSLLKLEPHMNQLILSDGSLQSGLLADFNAIKDQLASNQLDAAREGILAFGNRIKELLSKKAKESNPLKAEYETRRNAISADYQLLLQNQHPLLAKIQPVWQQLDKFAAGNNFQNCLLILDKLEPAIRGAVSSATAAPAPSASPASTAEEETEEAEVEAIDLAPLAQIQNFAEFRNAWPTVKAAWESASNTVDSQILKLQAALRETDDEDLHDIAEFGLGGVTGNFRVPFVALIRELDDCDESNFKPLVKKLLTTGSNFSKYLASADTVAVCDDNEFGVTLTIKDTLTGAINEVTRVLSPLAS